jgi:hypothetical protein
MKKSKMFPFFSFFGYDRLCFVNQLKHFSNKLSKKLYENVQIPIKPSSNTYICTSCLYNIN